MSRLDNLIEQMHSAKAGKTSSGKMSHWQKAKKRRYDLEENELDCQRDDNDSSADESDDNPSDRRGKSNRKKDLRYTDGDPLYDPLEDNQDESFVDNTFNSHHSSECTLCCPQCFTVVCYDATQHARYHTQFRANEVINIRTDESKTTKPKIIQSGNEPKKADIVDDDTANDSDASVYHCVFCGICGAQIGARETVHSSVPQSNTDTIPNNNDATTTTTATTTANEQSSKSDTATKALVNSNNDSAVEQKSESDTKGVSSDIWTAIPDFNPKTKDSNQNSVNDNDSDDDDEKPVTMEEIQQYLKEKRFIYHFYHVFPGNI